jgi:hypothetical protein
MERKERAKSASLVAIKRFNGHNSQRSHSLELKRTLGGERFARPDGDIKRRGAVHHWRRTKVSESSGGEKTGLHPTTVMRTEVRTAKRNDFLSCARSETLASSPASFCILFLMTPKYRKATMRKTLVTSEGEQSSR